MTREAAMKGKGGRSPRNRESLDGMGRNPGVPSQAVPFDSGDKGAVSNQEVDSTRNRRSAANACGLGADVGPFGGNKGVKAMKLLKLHVEVTPDEAGDPPRSFSIQQSIPTEGAGV